MVASVAMGEDAVNDGEPRTSVSTVEQDNVLTVDRKVGSLRTPPQVPRLRL